MEINLLKILLFTSAYLPPEEGIGNYVSNLSKIYIQKGADVTIVTRNKTTQYEVKYEDEHTIHYLPFYPLYPFHIHLQKLFFNHRIDIKQYDVIHQHSPLTPVISTSVPILTTVHTPMVVDSRKTELINFNSYIRRAMGLTASYYHEQRLIQKAQILTVVSSSVKQEVEENFSFEAPLYVLGNAVDHEEYVPCNDTRENTILFVGRFDLRKGIMDLLECIKMFKESNRTEQFILIGKGPLYNNVLKFKEKHNLSNITLPGFVSKDDLIRYYQTAKVYIMPSHYEGLPTVLLEAMSCGLPPVATSVSGNLDVIDHGHNGLLIPVKSPSIMRDSLIQILEDKDLHLKISRYARLTIENKYNWVKVGSQYYSLLNELVN